MSAVSRLRFVLVWSLCFGLLAGASASAFLILYVVLAPQDQREFFGLLVTGESMLFVFGVILFAASGLLADWLARAYLAPVRRLAESTRLAAGGNPAHRAGPEGPPEVRDLAAAVNALAERHQALLGDLGDQIRQARADADDEANRLAALMSELASSVVVCTVEGRILLYNEHARRMFSGSEVPGFIGLGRSLFSLLDRSLVAHALDQLRGRLAQGETSPVSVFLASPGPSLQLRVRMAPVMGAGSREAGQREPSGFVLLMDDVGAEVALLERRDQLLKQLIEGARASLAGIRAAAENLEQAANRR